MRFRFPQLALLCATLALLIFVAPARAGNYVVTNTYDDTNITDGSLCSLQPDACTLRGALYAASENPDADTIRMGNSAFVQNLNGPLPVVKTDVTLSSGVGTKLQANGFYRLLRVERGATLRLSGFQMVNGQTLDFGGAINSSGTLIVSNCLFRDNRVGNINSGGGAVSNFGGSATLNNCEFNNNFVRANGSASSIGDGGAVVSDGGTLAINRCLFVGNSAGALGIASGGAVAMRGGALSISNSEFRGNSAQNGGGAVSVNDASATLAGVTFRDNSTTNRDAAEAVGGALYFADSGARTLSLSNGTFVGNSANSGGAVANYGAGNALSLNYCTLVGNTARARGGAIEFAQGGGRISNSIVAGNAAPAAPNISGSLAASSNFNLVAASVAQTGLQTDSSGAPFLKDNDGPIAGRLRDGNAYADYAEQHVATVALTVSSPAVDAGGTAISSDARRVARPQGGAPDQGAFELTGDDIPYSNTTTKSFIVTTIADSFVSGQTTLRDAILASNLKSGADTITFAPGVSGTINLNKALPDLSSLTLVGPGKDVVSVRPATPGAFRIFTVPSSDTVTLGGLTLTLGQSDAGGALQNVGNVTLNGCRLTGNAANFGGGAIVNFGNLSLNNCLLGANNAPLGGAIYNNGGLTLATCQLTANTAQGGGALFNASKLTISDSLFSANIASGTSGNDIGGGAWLDQTSVVNAATTPVSVSNSTFSGNTAAARGGAIRFYSSEPNPNTQRVITLDSLTITRNRGNVGGLANDNEISPTGFTLRNSVVAASTSDGADGVSYVGPTLGTNNFLSGDPKLGPLQDNGGPLETIAPLAGSPLINAGATALTTDARGVARPQFKFADIGALEIRAADGIINSSLVVTTITDEDNGTSDPTYGTGTSLREAIDRANSDGKDSAITFASSLFATRQSINLALGELVLLADGKLTLDAPQVGLAISAGGRSRVLNVASGADVALSGLQITGGVSSQFGQGAGIYNAGTLNLRNATINGNSTSGRGAGIYNAGTATFGNVTITGNITYIYGPPGDPTSRGGGVYNTGALTLVNCTLANNQAGLRGGAIYNDGGSVTLRNALLAQNNQDDTDLIGVPNPGSSGDANGNFRFATTGDAGLSALADNGGQVPTMALSRTSPVLDKGIDTATAPSNLTTDARGAGYARKVNARVDVGAYELQDLRESPSLIVNTTQDVDDAYDFKTSLREAMDFANSDGKDSTIGFDATLFATRQTLALNSEIGITSDGKLFFAAPSAGLVLSRPGATFTYTVRVYSGADAYLSDLTFSNGGVSIRNEGTLDLKRCAIVNNRNLALSSVGTATLSDCTLAGNNNTAIYNGGTLAATNCTLVGNYAGFSNVGRATLTHCTLAGNTNYGITSPSNTGTVTLKNTLVVGNSPNINISFTDGGGNVTEGSAADAGLEVDADGALVLKDNGGPTSTVALVTRGAAVNRGTNANVSGLSFDQRGDGNARVQGGRPDAGAFESAFLNRAPTVNPTITPASPTTDQTITVTPNGADADSDALTYLYAFSVNGNLRQSSDSATFDLSRAGNGDVGDIVSVSVVANDGVSDSEPGTAQVTVVAANSAPTLDDADYSGTVGQSVSVQLAGQDAEGNALTYSVTTGALPDGLTLSESGLISGKPTRAGTFSARVTVSDGMASGNGLIRFAIAPASAPNTPPTLGNGILSASLNRAFSYPLVANDADGDPLTYTKSGGALPGGVTLNADGTLSGTPTQSGVFGFDVTVNDGRGGTATASFNLTIVNRADGVAPVLTRSDVPMTLTREQLAALTLSGTVRDLASAGVTPSGVNRVQVQLRRNRDGYVYNGKTFAASLSPYYVATLGAGGVAEARTYSRALSFVPNASVLSPGEYSLVLVALDKAGNYAGEVIPVTIVAPTSSAPSALRVAPSSSGGAS